MTNNINLTKPQTTKTVDEPLFVLYRDDLPDFTTEDGKIVIGGEVFGLVEDVRRDVLEANFLKTAAFLAAVDEHNERLNADLIVKLTAIIVENDPEIDPNRAVDSAKAMVKAGVTLVAAN